MFQSGFCTFEDYNSKKIFNIMIKSIPNIPLRLLIVSYILTSHSSREEEYLQDRQSSNNYLEDT